MHGDNKAIFVAKGDYIDQSQQIANEFKKRRQGQVIANILTAVTALIALLTFIYK